MKQKKIKSVRRILWPLLQRFPALLPGLFVFFLDQGLKESIDRQPEENFPCPMGRPDGAAEWQQRHNPGLALGTGAEHPGLVRGMATASMALPLAQYAHSPRGLKGAVGRTAGGLVFFGALSNLLDRYRKGYVVDYIRIKKGPLQNIVFNLGDAAIVFGGLLGTGAELFSLRKE